MLLAQTTAKAITAETAAIVIRFLAFFGMEYSFLTIFEVHLPMLEGASGWASSAKLLYEATNLTSDYFLFDFASAL